MPGHFAIMGAMDSEGRILVATLNLRGTRDRWVQRAPLLMDQLAALLPDVIGLQEVARLSRQGWWIRDQLNLRRPQGVPAYDIRQAWKQGLAGWFEGCAILASLPLLQHQRLELPGGRRVAQRARLALPGGNQLDMYNTHLHHTGEGGDLRLKQAQALLAWMERQGSTPRILVGDLNATPGSRAITLLRQTLRSGFVEVHGTEPPRTSPAPLSVRFGGPALVLDYILLGPGITAHEARVTFEDVSPEDARLSASDHYGLAAAISITA